jgi:hypothetical protein
MSVEINDPDATSTDVGRRPTVDAAPRANAAPAARENVAHRADAASEIGIATLENASAAATAPSHDFLDHALSKARAAASERAEPALDQRAGTSTRSSAPAPAAKPMTTVHPSHCVPQLALRRLPRIPSRVAAGSCARKPAITGVAINNPPVDTPATSTAVGTGNAICTYAPCSFGNKDRATIVCRPHT